jgi:hypothetical protein
MEDDLGGEMVVLVNKRTTEYVMVASSILEGYGIRYVPIPGGGDAPGPVGLMVRKADYEKALELIQDSGEDEGPLPATPPMNQKLLVFLIVAGIVLYVVVRNILK